MSTRRGRCGVTIALLFLGVAGACALADSPIEPPDTETIVVQGVLNAGTSQQTIWIERLILPGEPYPFPETALDPPPTSVVVHDATGPIHVFARDTAAPRRYVADFVPVAGRRYDLVIETGGRRLSATTTVPLPVTIFEPATDTIDIPSDTQRVAWSHESGRRYAWFVSVPDTTSPGVYFTSDARWVGADNAADIPPWAFPAARASILWVLATDSVTAALYDSQRMPEGDWTLNGGNIRGGVGVFGAVSWDYVHVRQP